MHGLSTIIKANSISQTAGEAAAVTGRLNFERWLALARRDPALVQRVLNAKRVLGRMGEGSALRALQGQRYQRLLDEAEGRR